MLFSPIVDAPLEHYFFVANMDVGKGREQDELSFVRSSQDHQYSFIRTPRTNVPEAALRGQIYGGTGIGSNPSDSMFDLESGNIF